MVYQFFKILSEECQNFIWIRTLNIKIKLKVVLKITFHPLLNYYLNYNEPFKLYLKTSYTRSRAAVAQSG